MLAKGAIKEVARAKGLPAPEADELTLLVPKKFAASNEAGEEEVPGVSLHQMIYSSHPAVVEGSRELRAQMAADHKIDEIIRLAAQLEGMKRNVSTHACGVLVTPEPVTNYVPVEITEKGTGKQATYDGKTLEGLGLLKIDFLGIDNLTTNHGCVARIAERGGGRVDWHTVPDDDLEAMALLRTGQTQGIFQFSPDFATNILRQIKPRKVQDLMVATALGRPGPMDQIPKYLESRAMGHGTYGDPVFERYAKPILEETYGILVYQEQIMLLAIGLADFTLTESDGLRKATAKKDAGLMAKYREQFIEGAVRKGVVRAFIEHFWDAILAPFASYSFNKSHSAAYALTAYKQAYLKAHYPSEFFAALMSLEQHKAAKERGGATPLSLTIIEARKRGIEVRPLELNRSTARIEIEDPIAPDTTIGLRMSLAAIKGVGEKAVLAVIAERAAHGLYTSLRELIGRTIEIERTKDEAGKTIPNAVNKTTICNLIKVGALDAFGDRGALLALAEAYFGTTSVKKRAELSWDVPPSAPGPTPHEYLDWEMELLGFYVSAHPASSLPAEAIETFVESVTEAEGKRAKERGGKERELNRAVVADVLAWTKVRDDEVRILAGIVTGLRWTPNRSGQGGRLVGRIEDETGACRLIVWQPRETDGRTARAAFEELQARAEASPSFGLAVAGGFSFNEKWDKLPGIIVERWTEITLAGRVAGNGAPAAEPTALVPTVPLDPTRLAIDQPSTDEGLAALFE
jgi:DNA polymerase-3 subunit alpha